MKKIISSIFILIILLSSFAFAESEGIKVEVNSKEVIFDVESTIKEGIILVPLRGIFESLGLEVSWDGTIRTVTGKNKDTLIKLQIDDDSAMVNGKEVKLDGPPVIINQRTLVSTKFIEDATGAKVIWDENTKTVSISKSISSIEDYNTSLTYSNLLDKASQDELRKAMESAGIINETIDFFFEELNYYNDTIEGRSLVEDGFITIDNLQPEYDLVEIQDMWDDKNPDFIGYNCRIITYDLMKDSIRIGKTDTTNSNWLIFDQLSLDSNPKEVFNKDEREDFQTFYSNIPAELTKDISLHLKNIKEDWKSKEIEFLNDHKRSVISVFFHDELDDYLFIGHMGLLFPSEDGKLLFVEKLSFLEPYQAIKFNNRVELNDYLMNKYDISWNQPTARPFIMENDQLLEGYREKPNNQERDSK